MGLTKNYRVYLVTKVRVLIREPHKTPHGQKPFHDI